MNNHIVLEPAWKIREIARNALKGYWKPMFAATLIFYLLTNGVGQVLSYVFSYDTREVYVSFGLPNDSYINYPSVNYGGSIEVYMISLWAEHLRLDLRCFCLLSSEQRGSTVR